MLGPGGDTPQTDAGAATAEGDEVAEPTPPRGQSVSSVTDDTVDLRRALPDC